MIYTLFGTCLCKNTVFFNVNKIFMLFTKKSGRKTKVSRPVTLNSKLLIPN